MRQQKRRIIAIVILSAMSISLLCSCMGGSPDEITDAHDTNGSVSDNTSATTETAEDSNDETAVLDETSADETVVTSDPSDDTTSETPADTTVQIPEDTTQETPEQSTAPEVTTAPEQTTAVPEITTEPPHVHSFATVWSMNAAQHWHACSCGEKKDAAAHAFDEWTVTQAATETSQGSKKRSCTVCGYEETQVIPTLDHVHAFSADWSKNAAQHWHACACGEKADADAHTFGDWTVTKEASCSETGLKKHVCTVCGYEETASVDKLAHTPAVDPAVTPTCTAAGKTEGSHCSICNTVITAQQTVPATGHTFGDWTLTTDATCTEKGKETRTCSVCSAAETRDIAALGHNYVETVVPPTVAEDGFTEHKCSRCNDTYTDNIVEATGSLGLAYTDNGNGTCTITGIGTCTDNDIYIPRRINGLTVNAIGTRAFAYLNSFESIYLSDTVTQLSPYTFEGSKLTSVVLTNNVRSIPEYCFYCCTIIEPFYFPNIYSAMEAFYDASITTFIFQDGIKTIPTYALSGTKIESIIIPDSVTKIGFAAFYCNRSLKNISIPNSVTTIDDYAFANCSALEHIELPTCLNTLGYSAFSDNTALKTITIPSGVFRIRDGTFNGCGSLSSIYLHKGLKAIERSAFGNTIIDSVYFSGTVEDWNQIDLHHDWIWANGEYTIHCTDGEIVRQWSPD